jgi:hypothetical protein
MNWTESQKIDLSNRGISAKYHDMHLSDYPKLVSWLKSKEGEEFLSGNKDLLLVGKETAITIGNILQQSFINENGQGLVTSLVDLSDAISLYNEEVDEYFRDKVRNSSSIFVYYFQEDTECPLNSRQIYRVCDHIRRRRVDSQFGQTILQVSSELDWYPATFQDFISDCFIRIDIDLWT